MNGGKFGKFEPVKFTRPDIALAASVSMTMRHPAFAKLRFGDWSRVLVGQINRGDYLFLMQDGKPVAFGGWVPTTHEAAEAWLEHEQDIEAAPPDVACCAVLNVMVADSPEATRALGRAMRNAAPHLKTLYAKRISKSGERRLVRLKVPPKRMVSHASSSNL